MRRKTQEELHLIEAISAKRNAIHEDVEHLLRMEAALADLDPSNHDDQVEDDLAESVMSNFIVIGEFTPIDWEHMGDSFTQSSHGPMTETHATGVVALHYRFVC